MKDILFNPILKKYKAPIGALSVGEEAAINLYINKYYHLWDLKMIIYDDNTVLYRKDLNYAYTDGEYNVFTVKYSFDKPYLYFYYFEYNDCYGKHYIGSSPSYDSVLVDHDVTGYQQNVFYKNNTDLSWYQGKVIYQIMVDRFFKGGNNPIKKDAIVHSNWDDLPNYLPVNGEILNNDFFGGDIQGIINKLDYLKSLNCGIIYLNPIFLSPSNHKYNTSDYMQIDPMFGNEDDLLELITKAKEKGIAIILDGVFNHTGDDSIYFNKYGHFPNVGACQSKNSPYYSWYNFIDYPNNYMSWWGIKTLPSINQNSSFVSFITGQNQVIDKWTKLGIRGFRLDVVDELGTPFLERITEAIKRNNKDNIVIGEVWEDASNKISYGNRRTYLNGKELDSVMNYPLQKAIIHFLADNKLEELVFTLRSLTNNYPKNILDSLMNILSTHDTTRILTRFSRVNFHALSLKERANYKMPLEDYFIARSKLKLASAILYTVPGVPCIFYGDEVGVEGYKDPFCRKTMPWGKFDEEILNWYRILGNIRKEEVFIDGEYEEKYYHDNIFIYSRKKNDTEIWILLNNSQSSFEYNLNGKIGIDLIRNEEVSNILKLYSQEVMIIKFN